MTDSEIRFLVASNPNTPIDILMKLGEEFPDTIDGCSRNSYLPLEINK